ncbi:MAG: PQQ-like beta-propeller repeat protein [Bacteroidales bacterium]|nr:PQQ-like beta-propeller repeat protein [Bacteroidales bacterium]
MMENNSSTEQTVRLLKRVATLSGIVALILSVMIGINYIQIKRVDPLNTHAIIILQEQLKSSPGDKVLQQELRELDLLARKAFFISRWQIRTGGYILLISLLIVIICIKWIEWIQPKIPPRPKQARDRFWEFRQTNQRWIIYTGIFLVLGSLALAFLTYKEIGKTLQEQTDSKELSGRTPGSADQKNPTGDRLNSDPSNSDQPLDELNSSLTISSDSTSVQQPFPVNSILQDTGKSNAIPPGQSYPSRTEILSNSATFRGPDGDGVVSGKNFPVNWNGITGENILWKAQFRLPGYNSPIVWNDRVFLSGASSTKREVYCFDATTGGFLWLTDVSAVPGTPTTVPTVDRETGMAASTLTTDGQRVYAIFATGDLVALDMDGKLVWAKNLGLPKNHYGHASSLIMYRDLVIVQWDQSQGASVKAFNGETGELVWNTPRDVRVSWSSPLLVNTGKRLELILVADPCVAAYHPATGKELWKIDCIFGEIGASAAYANGMLFATNEYAKTVAIRLGDTPQIPWETTDYMSDIPSPVANDKYLFLVTSYGVIVCYDAKTGKEYWIKELENNTYASPVLVDDRVYLMDKTGVMHIFKADKVFTSVSEPVLGEGSVCTPAFAGGKIYIRGDQNLYCIGK